MQVPKVDAQFHPVNSISRNESRGLDESIGVDFGCNNAQSIEDESCSGVSDNPSAEEIERGSAYEKTVSGESSRYVSEQSLCSEETEKDSFEREEMRQSISKENSSNDPVQRNTVSSSNHLASRSAISPELIALMAPYPEELERIKYVSLWAEEEWRKSVGWPEFIGDQPNR